ncbi:hypothetical protein F4781DRAFT_442429 [Annulohypoxylon bovei var. microspora]|nr:hypothetical protein F4781DRAFT_442429 [Annulohypoxylon bovei var. microspora]
MSELMGSVPLKANETNHKCQQRDSNIQQTPSHAEIPSQSNMDQPCLFLKGIVDDCYQSRLWARMLEFYFLDNDPKSFESCRCPMENCPKPSFGDPKQMLLHLKDCEFFKKGFLRCPECDDVEGFRTTSNKSCSWNRPSFKHRAQKKLKAALDFIRKFASSQPDSVILLGQCKNCGYSLTPDGLFENPKVFDSRCNPLATESQPPIGPFSSNSHAIKVFGSALPTEMSSECLIELPTYEEIQSNNKFNHSPYTFSAQSPSSNIISELDSSPASRLVVSPAFTGSSTTTSTNNSQSQSLSAKYHHSSNSASDIEAIPHDIHGMKQIQINWQRPRSTRLYDPQYTKNLAIPGPSFRLPSTSSGQEQSLSIQTSYPEPVVNNSEWENYTFYDEGTLDPMSSVEHLGIGDLSSSTPMMETQLHNIGTYLSPFAAIADENVTTNFMSPATPSPLNSSIPSSSSDQPPDAELLEQDFRCPHCMYKPKGKAANFRAYYQKHVRGHTKTEYKCEHCEKVYTRPDNRATHARKSHQHADNSKKRRDSSAIGELENPKKKRVSYSQEIIG